MLSCVGGRVVGEPGVMRSSAVNLGRSQAIWGYLPRTCHGAFRLWSMHLVRRPTLMPPLGRGARIHVQVTCKENNGSKLADSKQSLESKLVMRDICM